MPATASRVSHNYYQVKENALSMAVFPAARSPLSRRHSSLNTFYAKCAGAILTSTFPSIFTFRCSPRPFYGRWSVGNLYRHYQKLAGFLRKWAVMRDVHRSRPGSGWHSARRYLDGYCADRKNIRLHFRRAGENTVANGRIIDCCRWRASGSRSATTGSSIWPESWPIIYCSPSFPSCCSCWPSLDSHSIISHRAASCGCSASWNRRFPRERLRICSIM